MRAYLEQADSGYNAQQARTQGEGIEIKPEPVNLYKAEVEEFSSAILQERKPANSAELGTMSQTILSACYESAKSGKAVEIE